MRDVYVFYGIYYLSDENLGSALRRAVYSLKKICLLAPASLNQKKSHRFLGRIFRLSWEFPYSQRKASAQVSSTVA
jgi:hypothetical protein